MLEGEAEQVTDDAELEAGRDRLRGQVPDRPVGLRRARPGVQRPGCRWARGRASGCAPCEAWGSARRSLQPDDLAGLPMSPVVEAILPQWLRVE